MKFKLKTIFLSVLKGIAEELYFKFIVFNFKKKLINEYHAKRINKNANYKM
jgi:hypothetical protein